MRKVIAILIMVTTFTVGFAQGGQELTPAECMLVELALFEGNIVGGVCAAFPVGRGLLTETALDFMRGSGNVLFDSKVGHNFTFQIWEHPVTRHTTMTVQATLTDRDSILILYDNAWFLRQ